VEKLTPHDRLSVMQGKIALTGTKAFTQVALAGGIAMGLTDEEMLTTIADLRPADFYKSMTTHKDHRVWQDVYHGICPNGLIAYIKLTEVADRIVIQFKEK
jgi:motility quorum-sensing regulator/GCU-specific mRNA interferase toxin